MAEFSFLSVIPGSHQHMQKQFLGGGFDHPRSALRIRFSVANRNYAFAAAVRVVRNLGGFGPRIQPSAADGTS